VLHPWHKLSYFKQVGWLSEWVNAAEDIVHAEFKRSYAVSNESEDENSNEDIIVIVHSFTFHP
jgi:hypothetical protein